MTHICLGGTFNPIHYGHLISARAAAEALKIDCVRLIPCWRSPHKAESADLASAEERLEMCRLAIEGVDGFELDDREIRRGGPSYTIDTVRELKAEGWTRVDWLIGADQAPSLDRWHESKALLREANLVVMSRVGSEIHWGGPVVVVPAIEISSTEIRRRVAAGRSVDFLTPPAVVEYIRRRGLWLGGEGRQGGQGTSA